MEPPPNAKPGEWLASLERMKALVWNRAIDAAIKVFLDTAPDTSVKNLDALKVKVDE
jgi:hypothetical protein